MRLLTLTSTLVIAFVMGVLAVRLVGGMRPAPALYSAMFTNPDGSPCEMPCMFGIRPGTATIDSAVRTLRKHPFTRGMKEHATGPGTVIFETNEAAITITSEYLSSPDVQVMSFWFCGARNVEAGALGDAMIALGYPGQVTPASKGGCDNRAYTEVYHPDKGIFVYYQRGTDEQILPDDKPFALKMIKGSRREDVSSSNAWHGFGRYLQP